MFRNATSGDVPTLIEMGRRFHAVSDVDEFFPFDSATTETTIRTLIEKDDGLLLVVGTPPVGAAGILLHASHINRSIVMGTEVFWWLDEEHRGCGGALLSEMETRAKAAGVQVLQMSCMEALRPKAIARLYQSAGYRPMDHTFLKRL